jgi:beta-lactamase regulating signal transducer with metallopeptidase domain
MIPASILTLADISASGFGILFDTAVKGSVVVALAAIAAWLLRDRSAAARHAAWTAAVIGHLALPVLTLVAPEWRLPLLPTPGWLSARAGARLSSIDAGTASTPTAPASRVERSSGEVASPPAPTSTRSIAPDGKSGSTPSRTGSQRFAISLNLPTVAILALLWLVGAFLVLTRLVVGTFKVSRLAKEGERVDDGAWLSLTQRIAKRMSITRPLTLLRGDRLGIPVTWGVVYPAVLLPPDADIWPEERRRFVLVHEMAHVKRFDALTQLAAQITVAIFWFDPLLWFAAHRMRLEREHACDDYVLRDGTKPSLYAGELLEMVQSIGLPSHERAAPAFAALAMARRSEFEGRMLSILDPRLDRHTLGRRSAFVAAAIVALLILPLAALRPFSGPAPAAERVIHSTPTHSPAAAKKVANSPATPKVYTCDTQPPRSGNELTHVHVDADDDSRVLNYMSTGSTRCEEASFIGFARFSPDERQLVSLPVGSIAAFRERTLTHDRTVTVSRAPDGSLSYVSTMNGRVTDFTADARAWLSQLMPRALREMAIDVKPRVARVRAQGGVPAVLSMIRNTQSSASRRAHYDALISSGLSQSEREMVVRHATLNLASSESDLMAVLRKAGSLSKPSKSVAGATGRRLLHNVDPALLRQALTSITSDGDRVSLLSQYVQTDDPALLRLVLDGVEQITSPGDKQTILELAAPRVLRSRDASLHKAFFRAVAGIQSSGDKRTVLLAALPYGHANESITVAVLSAAADLSSDGDKALVLVTAANQHLVTSDAVMKAYLATTNTISSSGDVKTAMAAVLNPTNRD